MGLFTKESSTSLAAKKDSKSLEETQALISSSDDGPPKRIASSLQEMNKNDSYSTFLTDGTSSMIGEQSFPGEKQRSDGSLPRNILLSDQVKRPGRGRRFSLDDCSSCQRRNQQRSFWRIGIILAAVAAVLAYFYQLHDGPYRAPQWHWDHNVYMGGREDDTGQPETFSRSQGTISLIAQVMGGSSLRDLTQISRRPNRAYARDWGMDYVEYDSGKSAYDPKTCFDKVLVLNQLLEIQERQTNGALEALFSHATMPKYDYLLILSPDAIVMDLDENLIDLMLPDNDKLVAISGWDGSELYPSADILLFDLKHPYVNTVAKLWWKLTLPRDVTCGARNELAILLHAIAMVLESGESLVDLIQPLNATRDGIIGDHWIKTLQNTVPGARSITLLNNFPESCQYAAETAASVCYRYYPKCEVLST
jgi:hypothetical protein